MIMNVRSYSMYDELYAAMLVARSCASSGKLDRGCANEVGNPKPAVVRIDSQYKAAIVTGRPWAKHTIDDEELHVT